MNLLLKLFGAENLSAMSRISDYSVSTWIPAWLFPFLIAALAWISFFAYRGEKNLSHRQIGTMAALRFLAYCSILFILALPKINIEGESICDCVIPVIADGSMSMTIRDDENGKSRHQNAMELADRLLHVSDSADHTQIRAYSAGKEFNEIRKRTDGTFENAADADSTSLAGMLANALKVNGSATCPGIILLSDGADNSNEPLNHTLETLRRKRIPVYPIGIGTEKFRDISIHTIGMDNIAFIGEDCRADVRVSQQSATGETVRLRLSVNGEIVHEADHVLEKEGENIFTTKFIPAKTGIFELKAEVQTLAGEATGNNNTHIKNFRVIDKRIRALLAFGSPSWEFRYIAGIFERDKRVDAEYYLQYGDSRRTGSQFLAEFPKNSEDMSNRYDMIILSGIDMTAMPANLAAELRAYVEEKAGVLVISSDPSYIPFTLKNTELEDLVPVTIPSAMGRTYRDEFSHPDTTPMKFEMTEDGDTGELLRFSPDREENRKVWALMPPIYTVYRGGRIKPGGMSLLAVFKNERNQKFPALILNNFGRGSVLFLAFDSTWRWRMEYGDRFPRDFWGKVAQSLALPHLLNESAQSAILVSDENVSAGRELTVTAHVFDNAHQPVSRESVTIGITDELGKREEVKLNQIEKRPGTYRADYIPARDGLLTLALPDEYGAHTVSIRVLPNDREFTDCRLNRETLEYIAAETHGKVLSQDTAAEELEKIAKNGRYMRMTCSFPLWDSPLFLLLALACFSIEWIYRKLLSLD